MNYSRSKFSKHLHFLQLSYHNFSICATCAISGTSSSATLKIRGNIAKMISNSTFPHQIIIESCYNKFLIIAAYFHVALPLVPLIAQVAQIEQ